MRFIFDIDGVIRDLNSVMKEKYGMGEPDTYDYVHEGKTYLEWLEKDWSVLRDAPPSQYYNVALEYGKFLNKHGKPLVFWTSQRCDEAKKYTEEWLVKYFKDVKYELCYKTPEKKIRHLDVDDFLIEDNSQLTDYNRIILVDMLYNKDVKCERRVTCPEELKSIIGYERATKEGYSFLELNYCSLYHGQVHQTFKKYLDGMDKPFRMCFKDGNVLFEKI